MSNVLLRHRGISEMEFYKTADTIRGELTRFLMNDKYVPKKWRFVTEGKMTIKQVNNAYMSWRGYILAKDAYQTVSNMDKLYKELFGLPVK